jgi:hypothetical protein
MRQSVRGYNRPMQHFFLLRLRSESAQRDTLTPELVRQEIECIQKLLKSGILHAAWKRTDSVSIALLFDGLSEAVCHSIIETLPFSKAGVIEIQMVVPVEPYLDVYPPSADDWVV